MPRRPRHEDAVFALALMAAVVPALVAVPLLWVGDFELKTKITLTLFIVGGSIGFAAAVLICTQRRRGASAGSKSAAVV